MVMESVLAAIIVVIISMMFAGHLLVVGVVFLVAVAAVSRVVA